MEELRERYKFVNQYSSILDSPEPDNALLLSGVSTDPNILMTAIQSPLELSPPLENFTMIDVKGNDTLEPGWDSLEDQINID
jgi:hypothetical protein